MYSATHETLRPLIGMGVALGLLVGTALLGNYSEQTYELRNADGFSAETRAGLDAASAEHARLGRHCLDAPSTLICDGDQQACVLRTPNFKGVGIARTAWMLRKTLMQAPLLLVGVDREDLSCLSERPERRGPAERNFEMVNEELVCTGTVADDAKNPTTRAWMQATCTELLTET